MAVWGERKNPSLSIFLSFVDWTAGKGLVFAKMVLPGVFYFKD